MLIGFPTEDLSYPQSRLGQHLNHWLDQRWPPFSAPVWRSRGPTWLDPEVLLMIWDHRLLQSENTP